VSPARRALPLDEHRRVEPAALGEQLGAVVLGIVSAIFGLADLIDLGWSCS